MEHIYKIGDQVLKLARVVDNLNRGKVYEIGDGLVAKVFDADHPDLSQIHEVIKTILSKRMTHPNLCLPLMMVTDEMDCFVGYTMPLVSGRSLRRYAGVIGEVFPSWNRRHLVQVARELLQGIQALHDNGLLLGDVSLLDAMVDERGHVVVINSDRLRAVGQQQSGDGELRAVAVWLFQILMMGKQVSETFSLPLDDQDSVSASNDELTLWYCLPFKLREAFYDSLKLGRQTPLEDWSRLLKDYDNKLAAGGYELQFRPGDAMGFSAVSFQTTNLNVLDIAPEKDLPLRKIENVFTGNHTGRIGVLELSTKNVKLLVGPAELQREFSFNDFERDATQSRPMGAGALLNHENVMNIHGFRRSVLPTIAFYARLARGDFEQPWWRRIRGRKVDVRPFYQVDRLYVVATAAYRTAVNREEIVRLIKAETGLDVCILSKEEEAAATMGAFIQTVPAHIRTALLSASHVLFIDQGGGSTEVSLFNNAHSAAREKGYSLNLGTNALENLLRREQTSMLQGLDSVDGVIDRRLRQYFEQMPSPDSDSMLCVAVGSAITSATGEHRSSDYHGKLLTKDELLKRIDVSQRFLLREFPTVGELVEVLGKIGNVVERDYYDEVRRSVVMRLGLPIYVSLMEHFGIDQLTVSGTPLWYGIYFEHVS